MNDKTIQSISPLSPQQEGMLLETLSAPEPGLHIEQDTHILRGDLELPAFERAWQGVVERHAILRTAFVWKEQEQPLQVVFRRVNVELERQDWRSLSPSKQQARIEGYLTADRRRGFELSRAPLMRFALFQLADDAHSFTWSKHHLLLDGWSWALVLREVSLFYEAHRRGRDPAIEPSRPYSDYVAWLRQQDLASAERYWRKALEGFKHPTALGAEEDAVSSAEEGSDPPPQTGMGYRRRAARLPVAETSALQSFLRRQNLTLNTLVQGVWALLLSRYSGEDDILFGTTVSGRPSELAGVEMMVGPFMTTLPFRIKVPREQPFPSWLKGIQARHLDLRRYEYCSMGQVHQWSQVPGSLSLCESILVFENYPTDLSPVHSSGLAFDLRHVRSVGAQTKHALTVVVVAGTELEVRLIADARRFDERSAARVVDHFVRVFKALAGNPERPLSAFCEGIPAEEIPTVKVLPRLNRGKSSADFVPPRTPMEEQLARIWCEVLGTPQVSIEDSFFDLGGHSLIATRILSRLREAFSVGLPLRVLFEAPTVAAMAERIEKVRPKADSRRQVPALLPVRRGGRIPLSFAQQRLWFLHQMEPEDPCYNFFKALRIRGPLDVEALRRAFDAVVARHESLRTTFVAVDGSPAQEISSVLTVALPVIDLAEVPQVEREAEARRLAKGEARRPFDLASGPLLRTALLRVDREEHILLLSIHHIVSDAWSLEILFREVAELYEAFCGGRPASLPELPVQYSDFAVWQREWLQGEVLESQLAYWKRQLAELPTLHFPTDRPRPAMQTFRGAREARKLPDALREDLKAASRRERVSLYMTLLAAFDALLSHETGQEDFAVGSPLANRNPVETEGLIGLFINTVVLRCDLSGDPTFGELLVRTREVVLEGHAHGDVPFEKVVAALQPKRDLSHLPLFQVWFVLDNTGARSLRLPGLTVTHLETPIETARYDLELAVSDGPDGMAILFEYNTALFDAATVGRLLTRYERLLTHIARDPELRLSAILSGAEEEADILRERKLPIKDLEKLSAVKRKAIRL